MCLVLQTMVYASIPVILTLCRDRFKANLVYTVSSRQQSKSVAKNPGRDSTFQRQKQVEIWKVWGS